MHCLTKGPCGTPETHARECSIIYVDNVGPVTRGDGIARTPITTWVHRSITLSADALGQMREGTGMLKKINMKSILGKILFLRYYRIVSFIAFAFVNPNLYRH